MVVPIADRHTDFAKQIRDKFLQNDVRIKVDERSESMQYKIRDALQDNKIPYVAVVGDREIENGEIALRVRAVGSVGTMKVDDFINKIDNEIKTRKSKPEIGA